MKYSYEFKLKAVNLYHLGKWIDPPEWVSNQRNFREMIRRWAHLVECNGPDVLKHNKHSRKWTKDEKLKLVSKVLAGDSINNVSFKAGIHHSVINRWVNDYQKYGYNSLERKKRKTTTKELILNKNNDINSHKLKECEYDELTRLREENKLLRAENEAIKKSIALRQEKEAARLKAKKQQSSKN